MNKWVKLSLLVSLTGCGVSEEKITEQFCDWAAACEWPEGYEFDMDTCLNDGSEEDTDAPVCTFNKDAAKECSAALKETPCEGAAENMPSSCEDLYTCDE